MNRGSLYTREVLGAYTSPFSDTDELQKDRFRGPKSFGGFRETSPRQFTVNRVLCSFTNDIGKPYSCTPLISLCVTFVRLSNLATFLCRLKYCYCVKLNVQQLCRVSALLGAGGVAPGWRIFFPVKFASRTNSVVVHVCTK